MVFSDQLNPAIDPQQAAKLRVVLWRANKAVEHAETVHLRKQGLCLSDFAILEVLLHKGPLPVNLIGGKVLLTSGSITTAISRLASRGWVTKTADKHDRRISRVSLTPSGRRFIRKQYAVHLECLSEIAAALEPGEVETFLRLTKKIGRHAQELSEQKPGEADSR